MTRYRFLDGMGDVVADNDFPDHEDVQRVEFLGPQGDWRWAGPLLD